MVTTKATIVLTIEISGSTYGDEWTVGDIRKQAAHESVISLQNILKHNLIAVIGKPVVKTVTTVNE